MKKQLIFMTLFCFFVSVAAAWAGGIPNLTLEDPLTPEEKSYLGVSSDTFTLTDIDADYVFIEAFSMYCPVCQRDAPHINDLFEKVSKADTAGRVKFLGLGLGNNSFEVQIYKEKYSVPFPLVNDQDYAIHTALGEVGTPTYYMIKIKDGKVEILFMQEGEAKDPGKLLQVIKDAAGIK